MSVKTLLANTRHAASKGTCKNLMTLSQLLSADTAPLLLLLLLLLACLGCAGQAAARVWHPWGHPCAAEH